MGQVGIPDIHIKLSSPSQAAPSSLIMMTPTSYNNYQILNQTIDTSWPALITSDSFDVKTNDLFCVVLTGSMLKGATAGESALRLQKLGTCQLYTFLISTVNTPYCPNAINWYPHFSQIISVIGDGTLQFRVDGYSAGSDSVSNGTKLGILWYVKQ